MPSPFDLFWFLIGAAVATAIVAWFFILPTRGRAQPEIAPANKDISTSEIKDISTSEKKEVFVPIRWFSTTISRQLKPLSDPESEIIFNLQARYEDTIEHASLTIDNQLQYRPDASCIGRINYDSDGSRGTTWVQMREPTDVIRDIDRKLSSLRGQIVNFVITYLADEDDEELKPSGYVIAWEISARERETAEEIEEKEGDENVLLKFVTQERELE